MRRIDDALARALNAASSGIALADATVHGYPLTYVNESFERLTGYTSEECLARNCKFLQTPETDPAVVAAIGESLSEGRDFHGTLLNERKDGSRFYNELRLTIIRDGSGEPMHVLGVQNDVSALVSARHRLEQERDDAQAEVRRLLHHALTGEELARKRLLQVVHDDGLQHLMAASQDLAELEVPEADSGPLVNAKDNLKHAIRHLRSALTDIAPVALFAGDSLDDALRLMSDHLARSWRFTLDLQVDPAACGVADEDTIAAVRELVTNAGRHGRPRTVSVAVRLIDDAVELSVTDDGIGMTAGAVEQARREGHFGLALVHERVTARGGSLLIEPRPGTGVRAVARLPR